jgi:hypothetical protein
MTRMCHNICFNVNNSNNNNKKNIKEGECISSCYHKYLATINKMQKLTLLEGKNDKSEFVNKIFNPNEDVLDDYIFPRTGNVYLLPLWSFRYSPDKVFLKTGYDPFKNEWELR